MRSWLWYRTNGEIGGVEKLIPGGWPTHLDFNNPALQDPAVQNIRVLRLQQPNFAGFLPFDCECTGETCACAIDLVNTHRVDSGTVVEKPVYLIKVDGAAVDPHTMVDRAPGANVRISLDGPFLDGTKFDLLEPPGGTLAVLQTNPSVLTFVNGSTNEVVFLAPPRLNVVRLAIRPHSLREAAVVGLRVRGW